MRLWNLETGTSEIVIRHTDQVQAVSFSPDSTSLASASYDKIVQLWNVASGTSKVLQGHTNLVLAVAFSPDGTSLASASVDNTVRLWNVATGELEVVETDEDIRRQVLGGSFPTRYIQDVSQKQPAAASVYKDNFGVSSIHGYHSCLLPSPQLIECTTVAKGLVAVGYRSGQVVVVNPDV